MEDQAKYDVKGIKKLRNKEVILCYNCKGEGNTRIYNCHPAYAGPWTEPCHVCDGSGRLWMIITTEYYPFKSGLS